MAKPTKSKFEGFSLADAPPKPRIIGASIGEVGTGKTSWWLGAPGPILVFSLDRGLEGVIEKYQKEKEIYVKEYAWSPGEYDDDEKAQEAAIDLRDTLLADFLRVLPDARTILLDKETNIWELFRYAEFGAPNDAPRNYPKLNQRYRHFINMPKDYDCNFGVIQSMKDRWVTKVNPKTGVSQGANSGQRERQGFGEIDELVHIDIRHRRERAAIDDKDQSDKFFIDIGKSRGPGAADVQGQTFENVSFAEFAQMVFPDTTEEDWQ